MHRVDCSCSSSCVRTRHYLHRRATLALSLHALQCQAAHARRAAGTNVNGVTFCRPTPPRWTAPYLLAYLVRALSMLLLLTCQMQALLYHPQLYSFAMQVQPGVVRVPQDACDKSQQANCERVASLQAGLLPQGYADKGCRLPARLSTCANSTTASRHEHHLMAQRKTVRQMDSSLAQRLCDSWAVS